MSRCHHWQQIYTTRQPHQVSWYAPRLNTSLQLIRQLCPDRNAAIIDIGAGCSTLVDDLVDDGYRALSLLDISAAAVAQMTRRLGEKAASIRTHVGDITEHEFGGERFDLWHDRAVFHFLTEAAARQAYVARLKAGMKPGGYAVMATFGPEGPEKCSGLEVIRYSADSLGKELGLTPINSKIETHQTPFNTAQQFLYCWFQAE